jgi:probable HAF family extracellular repeat protein
VNLKSLQINHRIVATIATITFLALLAPPVQPAAQEFSAAPKKQPRYRLIDLGTFGGPDSSETVEFPFINNEGVVVGFADTSIPDPDCFDPECFLTHAFRWNKGTIADLGTLPGGGNSFGIWINDRGHTVGLSQNGEIDPLLGILAAVGVLWQKDGQILDLGTLGGNESLAVAINSRDQIVGAAANTTLDAFSILGWGTQTRAFLWQEGTMHDLGTLGGPDAFAIFVNDRSQVAGFAYTNSTPNPVTGVPTQDPFLWENGRMRDLGTLGGTLSFVNAFNNRGQVAGQSNLAGDLTAHPFLWDGQTLKDLGTLGGSSGAAYALNDKGEVGGEARTTSDAASHAFLWTNGVMTDLGTINDDTCSAVHWINSKGLVVGTSGDCDVEIHGFLSEQGGPLIDLNDFVPPGSDLVITDGETINDRGEIAGSGMLPNGDFHAIVLIPCNDEQIDNEGCRDAAGSANGTPPRLASIAAESATWARQSPSERVGGVRTRFIRRYHIPGPGVPTNSKH